MKTTEWICVECGTQRGDAPGAPQRLVRGLLSFYICDHCRTWGLGVLARLWGGYDDLDPRQEILDIDGERAAETRNLRAMQ